MRILFVLVALFSFNILAEEVLPCGEAPREREQGYWFELGKVRIKAPFIRLDGILCAATLSERGQIELITYRDDFGSSRFFKIQDFVQGSKVILSGRQIRIPLVKQDDLFSLRVVPTIQSQTEDYLYRVELRFDRQLRSSRGADRRILGFWALKSAQKEEAFTAVDKAMEETFNRLHIVISTGLKIKTVEVKDFEISRQKWQTQQLPTISEL